MDIEGQVRLDPSSSTGARQRHRSGTTSRTKGSETPKGAPSTVRTADPSRIQAISGPSEKSLSLARADSGRMRQIFLEEYLKHLKHDVQRLEAQLPLGRQISGTSSQSGHARHTYWEKCKKIVQKSPPWLTAGGGITAACLAGASLGVSWTTLNRARVDSLANIMNARANTATAFKNGYLNAKGDIRTEAGNTPDPSLKAGALYAAAAGANYYASNLYNRENFFECLLVSPDKYERLGCQSKLRAWEDASSDASSRRDRDLKEVSTGVVGLPIPEKESKTKASRKMLS